MSIAILTRVVIGSVDNIEVGKEMLPNTRTAAYPYRVLPDYRVP